jgi:hypothetical protein
MVDTRQRASGAPMPDPNATHVAQKRARLEAIRKNMSAPRVRVVPATEELRRVLRHPRAMRFRETGAVAWPLDSFTYRRLADGSIKLEQGQDQAPAAQPQPA